MVFPVGFFDFFEYQDFSQFNQFVPGRFVAKRYLKLVKPFSSQFPSTTFSEGRGRL